MALSEIWSAKHEQISETKPLPPSFRASTQKVGVLNVVAKFISLDIASRS